MISYDELCILQDMFEEQKQDAAITFDCKEKETECYFDFVDQYMNGNMNPKIYMI